MKQLLYLAIAFIFGLTLKFTVYGQDPGLAGGYAVSSQEYDFGDETFGAPSFPDLIEVRGSVHYPTDLSDGPFPVLLFLHGRHSTCYSGAGGTSIAWPCTGSFDPIPSYQGYDYLAEQMASHGYIVISVSANSISSTDNSTSDYGMRGRGELLQHHLNLWNEWNTAGGDPFGDLFVGKLDMNNIGTMGHSRGGEGVINHALFNREQGSPYGIKAVLTLAPVDFNRPVLNGIPVMNIAPYCDGDVSDLQGVHYYDDARYLDENDTMPKHNLVVLGANHNYYNTVWTPGLFPAGTADDWRYVNGEQNDVHCGTSAPDNGRLNPERQRNSLKAYASAFFRVYVGGETAFNPILKTTDITPPPSSTLTGEEIFMSYHPPSNKRIDINRTIGEDAEETNHLDQSVSSNGLVVYDVCGDDFGEQYCIGVGAAQEPHNKNGGVAVLGLSQLKLQWNSADDWWRNDIPDYLTDFSQFEALQFRAAVNFQENAAGVSPDFKIQLVDNSGASGSLTASDYTNALYFPPGDWGTTLPRTMHNTISLPIADFSGVDITDIAYVRFIFNESANGAILVSDLALSAANEVLFPPIASFEANVTETCTGEVTFTDNSDFFPTEWLWNFGDGTTSTEENPSHLYSDNGTYTVTLTVTNEAGSDSETITSYVTVDRPVAPSGTGDLICGPGDVTLTASGAGGELNWYATPTGGEPIGTGTSYTNFITSTTSFYVEEQVDSELLAVGPPNNTFGSGGYFNANDFRGLFFDVFAPFTLETVRVYANGAGNRTIQVLDGDGGSVVHEAVVFIEDGESVIDLGFELEPYEGYYMKVTGALVNLFRINDGSPEYPYVLPGIVQLTGSNVTDTPLDFYYFFFDWKIRLAPCLSPRTEVVGTVDEGLSITVSDDVTIAAGETTGLTATGGASYSWEPTTGLSDPAAASTEASPTVTTTYVVTVTDAEGCTGVDSVKVTVEGQIGIAANELTADFELYPNPTNGFVNLTTHAITTPYRLTVLTTAGKEVFVADQLTPQTLLTIDLSAFEKGMYYIRLSNDDVALLKRVVLQ